MKLKTHRYIAETAIILIEEMTGQTFNHRLVKIGACMPDIALNRRIKLHTPELAGKQYSKMLGKFESGNRSRAFLSYMIGSYSHYVADSFCYAHNYYVSDLKNHVQYEALFQEKIYNTTLSIDIIDHILTKLNTLNEITPFEYIEKENMEYKKIVEDLADWEQKIEIDLKLAIINSVVLMLQFIYEAQMQPVLVPVV